MKSTTHPATLAFVLVVLGSGLGGCGGSDELPPSTPSKTASKSAEEIMRDMQKKPGKKGPTQSSPSTP